MGSIRFEYGGKAYTLEYTRKTATALQMAGFDDSKLESQELVMIPLLFKYAFLAHHESISGAEIDDIYAHLTKKKELIMKIAEMYYSTVKTLTDEPEDSGKVEWTASW